MIPRQQSAVLNPLGSDFDRFLYAQVGDDHQGGVLSVVSALARLGVDPWEQAAILARLPVDGAVRALSALLARLPAGAGEPVDPVSLATHLVMLLPHGARRPQPTPALLAHTGSRPASNRWLVAAFYMVCILLLLLGARHLMQP